MNTTETAIKTKTEVNHTPGPWSIKRVPTQSRGGSSTAWVIGPFCACLYDDWRNREAGISEHEAEADAQLIAAAPDLLDACGDALFYVKDRAPEVYRKLRAAIAKATTIPK
jgi:hypothetical protein